MKFNDFTTLMRWYFSKKVIDVQPFIKKLTLKRIDETIDQCINTSGTGYDPNKFEKEVITAVDIDTILTKCLSKSERRDIFMFMIDPQEYTPLHVRNSCEKFIRALEEDDYLKGGDE